MSTALAIAGVTAVLRDLLNDGLINHDVSNVTGSTVAVTALPPDRVLRSGTQEASQLNIFLHQVTYNSGWRNQGLPSSDAAGTQRLSNPPLALDLHYFISAYGAEDLHAEILLGYAMELMHEHPVIGRAAIRTALSPSPATGVILPTALRALAECGLADQFERIRITPAPMNSEEMSRVWSAIQSHYRPTAAYQVSVVLIEETEPTRVPLPVLERHIRVRPDLLPPVPVIQAATGLAGVAAIRLDDTMTLDGFSLDGGAPVVVLENLLRGVRQTVPALAGGTPSQIRFTVPAARSADFPAGVYQVHASLVRPGETEPRQTNRLGIVLEPWVTGLPVSVARSAAGTASFSLHVRPHVRPGQSVSLILGQREIPPAPITAPANVLDFALPDAPAGNHLVRLRIDGADSPVIDRSVRPPVFLNQRIEIT